MVLIGTQKWLIESNNFWEYLLSKSVFGYFKTKNSKNKVPMATNALVVKPQKITFYSWDFPYIIYCYLFIGATLANARIDFQVV